MRPTHRRRRSTARLALALAASVLHASSGRPAEIDRLTRGQTGATLLRLDLANQDVQDEVSDRPPPSFGVSPDLPMDVLGNIRDLEIRHSMPLARCEDAVKKLAKAATVSNC